MLSPKYVKVPIDVFGVKRKVFMGLTKRQVLSIGLGVACGIIPFFIGQAIGGTTAGGIALFLFAAPVVFCGFYQKNGVYAEQFFKSIFRFYRNPRRVLYKSRNAAEFCELITEKRRLKRRLNRG